MEITSLSCFVNTIIYRPLATECLNLRNNVRFPTPWHTVAFSSLCEVCFFGVTLKIMNVVLIWAVGVTHFGVCLLSIYVELQFKCAWSNVFTIRCKESWIKLGNESCCCELVYMCSNGPYGQRTERWSVRRSEQGFSDEMSYFYTVTVLGWFWDFTFLL